MRINTLSADANTTNFSARLRYNHPWSIALWDFDAIVTATGIHADYPFTQIF